MAGIGFELKKIVKDNSILSNIKYYFYTAIISAGPWIISIVSISAIILTTTLLNVKNEDINIFLTSITYVVSASLIFTSFFQNVVIRYISDQIYKKEFNEIIPAYNYILFLICASSLVFAIFMAMICINGTSIFYKILMINLFVLFCCIWFSTFFLSGLKNFSIIVKSFGYGYFISLIMSVIFKKYGYYGLIGGFLLGNYILLWGLIYAIYHEYPAKKIINNKVLSSYTNYNDLIWSTLFYNLAIWVDKYIFWQTTITSSHVIGLLRNSPIYDFPIMVSYVFMIPGITVFFISAETNFAEKFTKFFEIIHNSSTLNEINYALQEMTIIAKQSIVYITQTQMIIFISVYLLSQAIFKLFGITLLHQSLLYLCIIAASLQIILLSIINFFIYLDQRKIILFLSLLFLITNIIFTKISIHLGVNFFGLGTVMSLLLTIICGLYMLNEKILKFDFQVFMQ